MVEKFQRKWKGEAAQKAQAIANPPPKKTMAQKLQAARAQQTIAATLGSPMTAVPAPAPAAAKAPEAKPAAPAAAPAPAPKSEPSKKA